MSADVEIAVRRRRHVARDAEAVGDDQRTETTWQRDAAVVRIAHRRLATTSTIAVASIATSDAIPTSRFCRNMIVNLTLSPTARPCVRFT
jgi:hypothetical protein